MRFLLCALLVSATAFAQTPPHRITKITDTDPPPQEVRVEVRVLKVGSTMREKVAALLDDGISIDKGSAVLDDVQTSLLLEAAMGDKATTVMQAPRIVAEAGKPVCVKAMDEVKFTTGTTLRATAGGVKMEPVTEAVQIGQRFDVTATPRKNGEHVRVELKYLCRTLGDSPRPTAVVITTLDKWGKAVEFTPLPTVRETKCEKAMTLPDGKTAVVRVGADRERVATECGPPVLSKIPYLSRLFKNVAISEEESNVFLLVTPKVLKAEPVYFMPVASVEGRKAELTLAEFAAKVDWSETDVMRTAAFRKVRVAESTEDALRLARVPAGFGK